VEIAFVGDIMLDRNVGARIDRDGPRAVLKSVRGVLREADLTVGNLETPLGTTGTRAPKRFTFLSDPETVEVLTDGGFDLVSLANNHILDYGPTALRSTTDILDQAGIAHVGVGENSRQAHAPTTIEVGGQRIAFLAYLNMPVERSGFDSRSWTAGPDSPGVAWGEPDRVAEDVTAASARADQVIVLLHSGWEKTETLSPEQQALGRAALRAGATAVVGAHPHRLQAHGYADRSFVAWSLGNFVFDYPDGTPETASAVLHLTLEVSGVNEARWTPVRIVNGYPRAQDPDTDGAQIMQTIERLAVTDR